MPNSITTKNQKVQNKIATSDVNSTKRENSDQSYHYNQAKNSNKNFECYTEELIAHQTTTFLRPTYAFHTGNEKVKKAKMVEYKRQERQRHM